MLCYTALTTQIIALNLSFGTCDFLAINLRYILNKPQIFLILIVWLMVWF